MSTTRTPVWVIAVRHTFVRDGVERTPPPTYWYGPDHGFGTTSGPLEEMGWRPAYCVATFPTRKAAETALRSVYGRVPRTHRAERIDEVVRP